MDDNLNEDKIKESIRDSEKKIEEYDKVLKTLTIQFKGFQDYDDETDNLDQFINIDDENDDETTTIKIEPADKLNQRKRSQPKKKNSNQDRSLLLAFNANTNHYRYVCNTF
jgi:hypothetical protein